MRGWMVVTDEGAFFVHRPTRDEAVTALADDTGAELWWLDGEVERCEAIDDLEISPANLLRVGVVSSVDCDWCGNAVFADGFSLDPEGDQTMAVVTGDGGVYCSRRCQRSSTTSGS